MGIYTGIRQTGVGWTGFVIVTENGRYLWRESCHIVRTTKQDAKQDAQWLKQSMTEINQGEES